MCPGSSVKELIVKYFQQHYLPSSPVSSPSPPVATELAGVLESPEEMKSKATTWQWRDVPWYGGRDGEVVDDDNKLKDDEASDD